MAEFKLLPKNRDEILEKCPSDFGVMLGRHSHNVGKLHVICTVAQKGQAISERFYGPSTIRNCITMRMCVLRAFRNEHDLTIVRAGT